MGLVKLLYLFAGFFNRKIKQPIFFKLVLILFFFEYKLTGFLSFSL
jgi:hypothetical protein